MLDAETNLRVLIVEDSADDAALLVRALRKNGYEPVSERVETAAAMRAALKDKTWDVIFSDYMIPGFGGMEALRIAKDSGVDLPFILTTGKVGEETAADMMRAGASDFIIKGRPERLGAVVKRELADAAARRGVRQAEIEWRAAFDSVRDAIFFHDAEFRVVRANLAYAALAHMSIQDVIGKRYWDVFPKLAGPLPACKASMESGAWGEEELKLPEGQTYLSRVFPIFNHAGKHVYSLHVMQDITERNQIRDAIETNERKFRSLIENASDLVCVIAAQGRITYFSPSLQRVGGYAPDEVLGRSIMEFVHPEDFSAAEAALSTVMHKHNPHGTCKIEIRFRHKNGRFLVMDLVAMNALDEPALNGIVINARDVTERKHAEQALAKVNRTLKTLSAGNAALVHAMDESEMLRQMCRLIVESGGYRLAWVGYAEHDEHKTVRAVAHYGLGGSYLEGANITWDDSEYGRGPAGTAIRTANPHIVLDATSDPDYAAWREHAVRLEYGSVAGFPLISAGTTLGALCIYAAEIDTFEQQEIALLSELAGDLAFGIATLRARIAHQKNTERLGRSMEGTIQAMANTLEIRDAYTAGHQRRVAELTVAIARELKLPDDEIRGMHLAAVIHDLGKIQIPAEILSKPTRLTPIEFKLIKVHPETGYNILKEIDFEWPIAQMVYQHHERLDGSGYPRGLKGDEILPGARILAVADTVEAMASHRPYRPGLGIESALAEITRNRVTHYDAAVVDACVKLFREKRFEFSA